jgi:zinc transporter ZupT
LPGWVEAFLWGLVVGSGLMMGVVTSYFLNLPHRLIAAIMGFGSGVLISVLAFELLEEAYIHGGLLFAMTGFFAGAIVFSGANWLVSLAGGKHRKRCSNVLFSMPITKRKAMTLPLRSVQPWMIYPKLSSSALPWLAVGRSARLF